MSNQPQSNPPNRGHLTTEKRLDASSDLDVLSVEQILELISTQDMQVPILVGQAIPLIAPLVKAAVDKLREGGRLIYLGAGTSGRLGVLDASECAPTFHCDPDMVVGLIAGGDRSLRQSSEGAEDDPDGARDELEQRRVGPSDLVVGIAAGGTTPYVRGGLHIAKQRSATTALLCCTLFATDDWQVDHKVELAVGPEVLTGSTRMKAGTATKLVLNMITTATMVQLGKVWGNLMVDLRVTNAKLLDRAVRILAEQCDLTREDALVLLDQADGRVKHALVMAKRQVDADQTQHLLDQHDQQLRRIIGPP